MAMANSNSGGQSKKAPIKVKQDMIDFIKTQGMTKALKRAGEIKASGKGGEAEFLEGVKRMYGANRLTAATKTATPKKGSYTPGSGMAKKGTYTTGSGVSNKAAVKPKTNMVTKPSVKSTTKKSTTTDPLAKAVFGVTKKVGAAFTPDWKKKEQAAKKANK